ncbi:SDR family oxidoreductase [Pseudomonas aeruginosa]|uniref:UDP-glucose 4-epimerase family protein n=1 Tax=Pseudomonas aeruginosa TaxID=287 RepID=UPI0028769732|nr:SDR family oxidoreductase [Pseudomonas aeruginosa]MDS1041746.1 SDR family oxidoreductase [Pseudomonas aeruginosa]
MTRHNVLVTGATGFIGAALVNSLCSSGQYKVWAGCRRRGGAWPRGVTPLLLGELGSSVAWDAESAIDTVVHCAARVHVMSETASDPLVEFRKANVQGTLDLAREAVSRGVRRFIFISSIKVNGEGTEPGRPYTADSPPNPVDPYGVSKREAEQALLDLAEETGLEVVIIRPVLVYGPGVKANVQTMMRWLKRGVPLPLGAIHNRRSLVSLDNLVDLIITCIEHPAAVGQVFLVSDGEDLSTTELLRRMGRALGAPARLLPVPASWIGAAAKVLNRQAFARRLCGSLQVDIMKTRQVLGWTPPVGVDQALEKTARSFLDRQ